MHGTYKPGDPCSTADKQTGCILVDETGHDGLRYHVAMLWADDRSNFLNSYFSTLYQESFIGHSLEKSLLKTVQEDLSKNFIVPVELSECFNLGNPLEVYLPHHSVFHSQAQLDMIFKAPPCFLAIH